MVSEVNAAVEALYRSDWGRIVATLIRLFGDFDLAEEVAQEAFAAALDQWQTEGVPGFPRAWVIQTARHKAIDRIRRRTRFREKLDTYASELGSPVQAVKGVRASIFQSPFDGRTGTRIGALTPVK